MSFITVDFETFYETRRPADLPPVKEGGRLRFSLIDRTYESYILDPLFQVHCVGIQIDDGEPYVVWGDEVRPHLEELFYEGNDHTFLAHNNLFDAAILAWHFKLRAARYQCTKMMAQAIWPHASSSLKNVAKRLFPDDQSLRKGEGQLVQTAGLRTDEIEGENRENFVWYCGQDVNLTFRIYAKLWPVFPDKELDLVDWTVRCFAHPPFELDRERIQRYMDDAQAEIDELIAASGISRTTLSSNKQFAEYLEAEHGIEVQLKSSPTPKNPDNETWALAKNDLPFIDLQEQYPELDHIWKARIAVNSTIGIARAKRMLEHHERLGRMALGLNAFAAHTKRWGGTNKVNAQNFPRGGEHRRSILAPEGYVIVVRDQSNIEGRMNAWHANETWKLEAFARGEDLYNDLASEIYGRPVDRKKCIVGNDGEEFYPDFKEGFVGKTAELGLGYQTGGPKLRMTLATSAARVLISLAEAEHIKDTWRRKNQKIVDSWEIAQKIIWDLASKRTKPYEWGVLRVEHQRLVLPSGLALTYPGLKVDDAESQRPQFTYWNGDYYTNLYGGKVIENVIQALARIVLSDQLLEIDAWLREAYPNTEAQVGLTVHDELVAVVPEEHAQEANAHMAEVMTVCPDWCSDGSLVLASEGGIARNYSK